MIEKFFQLRQHGTNVRRELVAGLTTFSAMAYILAVNPSILEAAGMDRASLVTVTALAAALGTLLMGLLTNYPIVLAPGMGINAFFALTICQGMGVPWQAALSFVFWNGVLFLLITISGVREMIVDGIPRTLKIGVQCGIGLFIAFIGLKNAGIVVSHPATFVTLGDLSSGPSLLALVGVFLTVGLMARNVPGAILLSIIVVTALGLVVPSGEEEASVTRLPESFVGAPASVGATFLQLEILYPFRNIVESLPIVFALLFVDLFDTVGTLIGVGRIAGLADENDRLPKIKRAFTADSIATMGGALLGTSTVTSYIESAAGVKAGGRTGLTALVVALGFLVSLLMSPFILMIPAVATAPALIVIGITMMEGLRELDLTELTESLPPLLTMIMMPLAFSISEGIAVGFIAYAGIMLIGGKGRCVAVLTYVLAAVFLVRYFWM